MQTSKKLVLVYLAVMSALAMGSEAPRALRDLRDPTNYGPVRLLTILTNELTAEPSKKPPRLMGGHLEGTPPPREEDEAQWDDGLTLSSAGNGKENKKPHVDDDEKKTLAQQVKEGKYGLIQNEINPTRSKRPGVISYLSNPEVPKDTAKNLGGLDEEEIWLAENHVLVLRGGNFPDQATEGPSGDLRGWSPIDDFQAPKRQVKIPSSPKVPPPFPIQLTEGGPVTVIGGNDTEKPQWFDGLIPANETFLTSSWNTTEDNQPDRKTNSGPSLGGIVGPFFPALPPGAVFLPPPGNQSDYDEDDQSIYYPPPYSFKYTPDNSTAVPPGPLVPGIILPPPPDFFSQLDDNKATKSPIMKYLKRPSTAAKPQPHFHRKSNPKPHKFTASSIPSSTKEPRPFTMKPLNKLKLKNTTTVETASKKVLPLAEMTTSPNRLNTVEISEVNTVRPIVTNQVIESSTEEQTERPRWTGTSLKSPPIVAYYASSPSPIDEPVDITAKTTKPRKILQSVPSSASYYFYEEASDDVSGTTPTPVYFQETSPSVEGYSPESQTKKPYFIDVVPSQSPDEYNVEVIEPVIKTSAPEYQYTVAVPRAQPPRMLSDDPIIYKTVTDNSHVNLHSFFTTPTPERLHPQPKSKPVYQYSFEAADYAQRGRQKKIYKPIQEIHSQKEVFNEWQDEIQNSQQYNDYDGEVIPEQRLQPERSHYRTRAPNYPTTIRPNVVDTTENPQHAYYTKQEERLLDDVTREYFTNFGRKITKHKLVPTTPIYGKESEAEFQTEEPNYPTINSFSTNSFDERQKSYDTPRVKVHYGDQTERPFSLEGDTRVNYRRPLPTLNPDAEFLPGYGPTEERGREGIERFRESKPIREYIPVKAYRGQTREPSGPTHFVPLEENRERQRIFPQRPISLDGDTAVNYRVPRPPINPDAEFIDPGTSGQSREEKLNCYFAYRLPGDGGHFYFLTPHAISQGQEDDAFDYSRPRGTRRAKQRRGPRNV
uniref:Uncharacterized protein n=1 Tax=Fopius arisanus TaxID=64838 RepID=A0A0C9RCF7_9HYME